jgi:hypothetical protein
VIPTLPPYSGEPMCNKCNELQRRIDQFSRFIKQPLDPLTVERMTTSRSDLEREKSEMHCDKPAE